MHKDVLNLNDALIALKSNKIDEALKILLEVYQLDQKNLDVIRKISNIYREKKNISKYNFYLTKAATIDKKNYKLLNNLALTYKDLDNYKQAEKYFLKSFQINRKYVLVNFNLGLLYEEKGELEKAKKFYLNVIDLDNKYIPAYYNLQRIDKGLISNESYKFIEKTLKELGDKKDKDISYGYFLLANKIEIKDTYQEMKYLKKGHDIFFNSNHLYRDDCNLWLNFIPNMMKKKINYTEIVKSNTYKELEPIFIFGLPRSGTTLVETIISSGKIKVPNTGEASIVHNSLIDLANKKELKENKDNMLINFKKLNETINFKYNEIQVLKDYVGTKFIDRTMVNFFFYEIIFKIFQNIKIIHCKRNYFHNLVAIHKQCLENLPWTHSIDNIIRFIYLFDETISKIKLLYPKNILTVDLEDLTNNPDKTSKLIMDFCDLKWSEDVLKFHKKKDLICSTASNIQIRNKIYKYDNNKFEKYKEYFSDYISKYNLLKI